MSQALTPPTANNKTTAAAIIGVARPLVGRVADRAVREGPERAGSAGRRRLGQAQVEQIEFGLSGRHRRRQRIRRAAAGTSTGALHFGHGTRRPARFSGADNFCRN